MADKVLLGGDKKTKSTLEIPNREIRRRNQPKKTGRQEKKKQQLTVK